MTNPTDPKELVASLDPEVVRRRLDEIEAEESELRVLIRAAIARGRQRGMPLEEPKEASHPS